MTRILEDILSIQIKNKNMVGDGFLNRFIWKIGRFKAKCSNFLHSFINIVTTELKVRLNRF